MRNTKGNSKAAKTPVGKKPASANQKKNGVGEAVSSSKKQNTPVLKPNEARKRSATKPAYKQAANTPYAEKRKEANDGTVSINKYISDSGFCSRREADKYIEQARVTINGAIALSGNRVATGDIVEIDGEALKRQVKTIYIALNKPVGVTSTTDVQDKDNVIRFVGHPQRIFPIGRLDKDSEGLLLLTNDGNIVNKILRAGNKHEKEYIVVVDKPVTPEFVKGMRAPVPMLGTQTLPAFVQQEGKNVLRIRLVQGLNRQIRRMCQHFGYKVTSLKRIRIMNIVLAKLPVGHWRYLSTDEINTMLAMTKE